MRSLVLLLVLAACPRAEGPGSSPEVPMTVDAQSAAFLRDYEATAVPASIALHIAYWEATTTGDPEAYGRVSELEVAWRVLHSDPDTYRDLVSWSEGEHRDELAARQVVLLRNAYAENQIQPRLLERMVELSVEIEEVFNTARGQVGGESVSANEIYGVLATSIDTGARRAHWEASKAVGPQVADKLVQLVEVRNEAAREAGYPDFYAMRLALGEQDPHTIATLFQEIDALTEAPFALAKADIDSTLAARYGVAVEDLRPWHYNDPYFQEMPRTLEVDLDGYYEGVDVLELERGFWGGIGLPVEAILDRSDLVAREGKQQAAFCLDVDRMGDVRVLANIEDDEYWNGTMLHELGHAVYDAEQDEETPWLLRAPAHSMTTEAVALLFGRLSKDPLWMGPMLGLSAEDLAPVEADLRESQRLLQLVFARWSLVMVEFERALYADPHQDLQELWWSLVEEHQGLTRPEGREGLADWATKVHIISSPAYYHNYVMGELLASQLLASMATDLGGVPVRELSLVGRPEVGAWMKERVFSPGARYPWDALVERATGERLTARHWAAEFVESP